METNLTSAIENYVRYMKQKGHAEKTISTYISVVKKLAEIDGRLYRLSNQQIQEFILQSKSHSAQNIKINALKGFYRVNHPRKRISVFIRPKPAKKIIEILSIQEVQKIINSIAHCKQKAIIAGIYYHGLRISEILKLKYTDIDRDRNLLIIRKGKGNRDRLVPLNESWLKHLTIYAKNSNHKKGYIHSIFKPYSVSSIRNVLKRQAIKVGITKYVYPHLLRDCYASHLLEQNIDSRIIQEILGHSSIKTTEKYLHVSTINLSNVKLKVA